MPPKAQPTEDRFWPKVEKTDSCWLWRGRVGQHGYGQFPMRGKNGWAPVRAHRLAFELSGGELADGLHLHHRCGNKICVNPAHLEQVTAAQHAKYHPPADHCRKGHPFTPENTEHVVNGQGRLGRTCRTCHRERQLAYLRRRKARAAA